MNILGCIIKGLAPAAIDIGTQFIRTKMEENVMDSYRKKILSEATDLVAKELINEVVRETHEESKPQQRSNIYIAPEPTNYISREYVFDIHDYM